MKIRAQFAQDAGQATNLSQDNDCSRGNHRGCYDGDSCGRHHRPGDDGDPRVGNEVPPLAEPPYIERGPSNQNDADLPPQLGIYRPIGNRHYRN